MTTLKTLLFVSVSLGLANPACAQADAPARSIQIRTVLHDPAQPSAVLFVPSQGGSLAKLNLASEGLTDPQVASVVNGSLSLFSSAVVDPKDPNAKLSATTKVPAEMSRMIVLVVPAAKGTTPPYRMLILDDSAKAFGKGESRVVNLTPVEFAMEVGDAKIRIPAANVTPVPRITKLNEFNQAQTNFYYKEGESWAVFSERQLQYIDTIRRIFLISTTPGAVQPDIRTIVDYSQASQPVPPK